MGRRSTRSPRTRLEPALVRAASALCLLAAVPLELSSESLTLTTYYPAPLGVYAQLITTGVGAVNTLLARDSGNVGVGTAAPAALLDVEGRGGGTAANIHGGSNDLAMNVATTFPGNWTAQMQNLSATGYGLTSSAGTYGLSGSANSDGGVGVSGQNLQNNGNGVQGFSQGTTGGGNGVYGQSNGSGNGVYGYATSGTGVNGYGSTGVNGNSSYTWGVGVEGQSSYLGVYGYSPSYYGVEGYGNSIGVLGYGPTALYGYSWWDNGSGLQAFAGGSNSYGVYAENFGSGWSGYFQGGNGLFTDHIVSSGNNIPVAIGTAWTQPLWATNVGKPSCPSGYYPNISAFLLDTYYKSSGINTGDWEGVMVQDSGSWCWFVWGGHCMGAYAGSNGYLAGCSGGPWPPDAGMFAYVTYCSLAPFHQFGGCLHTAAQGPCP